jgi:hypothetical protein
MSTRTLAWDIIVLAPRSVGLTSFIVPAAERWQ